MTLLKLHFVALQDECRQLSEAVSSKDDEVLAMVQEKTLLASQKTQLEQLLSKKQQSYEEETKSLKENFEKLQETHATLQREYECECRFSNWTGIMYYIYETQ